MVAWANKTTMTGGIPAVAANIESFRAVKYHRFRCDLCDSNRLVGEVQICVHLPRSGATACVGFTQLTDFSSGTPRFRVVLDLDNINKSTLFKLGRPMWKVFT